MAQKYTTPDWLTIGQAAKYLGVSPDTLRRWERRGKIKCYRTPGGRRLYTQYDLESTIKLQPNIASFTHPVPKKTPSLPPTLPQSQMIEPSNKVLPQAPTFSSHPIISGKVVKPLLIAASSVLVIIIFSGLGKRVFTRIQATKEILKPVPETYLP